MQEGSEEHQGTSLHHRLNHGTSLRFVNALRLTVACCFAFVALGSTAGAGGDPFAWFAPRAAPAGWQLLVPPSGTSLLWYPPSLRPHQGDAWSVTALLRNRAGTDVLFLNAGPRTGTETYANFPAARLDHLREEKNRSVHEEAARHEVFRDGRKGSCVIDDYVTRRAPNHYREIACLVQGTKQPSVIVAAVLVQDWARYGRDAERAVSAWQVR